MCMSAPQSLRGRLLEADLAASVIIILRVSVWCRFPRPCPPSCLLWRRRLLSHRNIIILIPCEVTRRGIRPPFLRGRTRPPSLRGRTIYNMLRSLLPSNRRSRRETRPQYLRGALCTPCTPRNSHPDESESSPSEESVNEQSFSKANWHPPAPRQSDLLPSALRIHFSD